MTHGTENELAGTENVEDMTPDQAAAALQEVLEEIIEEIEQEEAQEAAGETEPEFAGFAPADPDGDERDELDDVD